MVEVVGQHGPLRVCVVVEDTGLADVVATGDGTEGGHMAAVLDRATILRQVNRLVHGVAEAAIADLRAAVNEVRPMVEVTDRPPATEPYANYAGAGGVHVEPPLPTWSRIA